MESVNESVGGRKLAAITVLLSVPLAILTQLAGALSVQGDYSMMSSGLDMLSLPPGQAHWYTVSMWFDVFGYYAIYLPVIVYAWKALRHIDEYMTDLCFLCGVIFCVLGTIGAMVWAGAHQSLLAAYAAGTPVQQQAAAMAWEGIAGGQGRGLWLIQSLFATVWLLGLAKLLMAIGKRYLGLSGGAIGVLWLAHYVTWVLGMQTASMALIGLIVMVTPLWAIWLGLFLWPKTA